MLVSEDGRLRIDDVLFATRQFRPRPAQRAVRDVQQLKPALTMSNPVLVEVLRGDLVESPHTGSVAVFDAAGKAVLSIGDVGAPVFPRSAVKAIQALPLVESGAADALRLRRQGTGAGLRLAFGRAGACRAGGRRCLRRPALDGGALECGAHWPSNHDATVALARAGESPSALHNNCSGKHSGFLCALPASQASIIPAMSAPTIPTRRWCAARWRR